MAPVPRRIVFAVLGLLTLLLAWQAAFVRGGPFVMPRPADTLWRCLALVRDGALWCPVALTAAHALGGFAVGAWAGLLLGLAGGAWRDLGATLQGVSTIALGMPPIIWIVLALFWFGPQGATPVFVVAVGVAPVVFAATMAGLHGTSPALEELATAFGASWRQRLFEVRVPQLAVAVAPALATALGFSWKIALMAEVIDAGDGIGGAIATARAQLDMVDTMAWVVVALALLLGADALLALAIRPAAGRSRP